jgi:hypothetical protein
MEIQERPSDADEFITIIGASMADIANAFSAQGLAMREFAIVHKIERHRFTVAKRGETEAMFEGQQLLAATFARRAGA